MPVTASTVNWLKKLDPFTVLSSGKKAIKVHKTLFWASLVISVVILATPLRNAVWIVNFFSLYTIWFLHIDGAQASYAHKAGEEDDKTSKSD